MDRLTSVTMQNSTNSRAPRAAGFGTSQGLDSAFTDRVRLYLKVTFLINVFLELGAIAVWQLDLDSQSGQEPVLVQMGIVTLLNGLVWGVVARTRPSFRAAIITQGLVTLPSMPTISGFL